MSVHQIWGRERRAVPPADATDNDVEDFIERRSAEIDDAVRNKYAARMAATDAGINETTECFKRQSSRPEPSALPMHRPVSRAARIAACLTLAGLVVFASVCVALWFRWSA